MKIFLATRDPLFRMGMRLVLSQAQDVDFIGEASESLTAIEEIDTLEPEVALLDDDMSGLTAIETIRILRQQSPALKIILFSNFGYHDHLNRIFAAGADGCVIKNVANGELMNIIRSIYEGRSIESPFLIGSASYSEAKMQI